MEDLPYKENRVCIGEDGVTPEIYYQITSEARNRVKIFRTLVSKAFSGFHKEMFCQAKNNQRLAHASGTCRMGTDSENSVVDKFNRVHGFSNLYVIDASFFPSSGGINPALTLAANSLRVAEVVTAE